MTPSSRGGSAPFATRVNALRQARVELLAGTPGAGESIRRLARLFHGPRAAVDSPGVKAAAAALDQGADADLAALSEQLINVLVTASGESAETRDAVIVLLVEPDPREQAALQSALAAPSRRVIVVNTIAAAETCLDAHHVALAVIAIVLPDGDGRNLLLRLREDTQTAGISTIVTSRLDSPQVRTECYALGCDRYFDKPVDADQLAAAAASLLDRAQRHARERQRDARTGLPNRAALRDAYAQVTHTAAGLPLAIASVSIDEFAAVRMQLGSEQADAALRLFAHTARQGLRPPDVIGRWTEDQFVVLFPATDDETAATVLANVQQSLSTLRVSPDHPDLRLSLSAGIAAASASGGFDAALAEADRFLFEGKAALRGSVVTARRQPHVAPRAVLLAEDDPVIAALVRHRLSRDGFEVIHAANGNEALTLAGTQPIALAILDVNMPGLNGLELLERLRKEHALQQTPIMMLTAMGNEADVARALALGADDYVVKPFSPIELLARVRRLVSKA